MDDTMGKSNFKILAKSAKKTGEVLGDRLLHKFA
jgi:hypothetical protein